MINVFHIVSGKNWGGQEQYTYDLVSRLRNDKDFYVEVVCKKHENILQRFSSLEIPISILPLKGMTDLDSPVRFARMLTRGNNVVHVHSLRDAFTAILARHISENPNTRVVMTLHGIAKPRNNMISRRLYKEIDRVIFTSQLAYDSFARAAKRFNASRALVIRESVLPKQPPLMPLDLRKQLNMTGTQALIMFHGRLCPEKGIETLLRAATQLDRDSFSLAIAGEGQRKYTSRLKGFIVANQLVRNVSFLGYRDDVDSLIKQCDFGVIPSIVPEAMGIANLEYMLQGKPVITTSNGAQPEYITSGVNGVLVEPGNFYQLADAIKSLIDDPILRTRLGAQAMASFNQSLNYDIFYNSITSLYKSLFTA